MIEVVETAIAGALELHPRVHSDDRGSFVKTYMASAFQGLGLPVKWPEVFFSTSQRGVIRGLHFQAPPAAQHKVVFCTSGSAMDVAVDLRVGSPTYGKHVTFGLDANQFNMAFIPVGFAHGFAALEDDTVVAYLCSEEFVPELDTGVRYDSANIDWPFDDPITSDRDRGLPLLGDLASPFQETT